MNEVRVKSLLLNKYQFCPLCNRNTIQQKVLNKHNEFYCVTCGNIFKKTEPLVEERYTEDEVLNASNYKDPSFEGWEVEELKDEISRLQDILDKHRINY